MFDLRKAVRMLPVCIVAVSAIICLYLTGTEHVFSASQLSGHHPVEQWEDPDYWVHIRNVSIFAGDTDSLSEDMYVLVVGAHIHKIGKVPMMIFDKDLTFNYDGEGRILMPVSNESPTLPGDLESTLTIKEGAPANLVVIDARSVEDLHRVMARPEWSNNQQRANLDAVMLSMENGWISKDTLPIKRIDAFRLQRVKEKRKEKGLDSF